MNLPNKVFLWLKGLHVLENEPFDDKSNRQFLNENSTACLIQGIIPLELCVKICNFKKMMDYAPSLDRGTLAFNQARRILNWKKVFDTLYKLGLAFESEVK